jgi:predicted nucleic acid-binding protein
MYILDTNVISELRKAKKAHPNVKKWAEHLPSASLYISVISVLELEIGILLIGRRDEDRRDKEQGAILRAWMDRHVLPTFSGRILAIDTAVAQRCATLHIPALHVTNPRSDRDALIAATALVHGLTVATRNVADFEQTGVAVVNPWGA